MPYIYHTAISRLPANIYDEVQWYNIFNGENDIFA